MKLKLVMIRLGLSILSQRSRLAVNTNGFIPIFFKSIEANSFTSSYMKSISATPNFRQETQVLETDRHVGILKKLMKKVGWSENSKSRLRMSSYILYESVADQLNYTEFFEKFGLPNTFNSWFLVTELHVWMLLLRAMAEGSERNEDGRFLRNCIVEAMWSDVNTRAKKLGANNPSGTRNQIHILSHQFQAALINYDEGLMSDDKVLAGALWRRFFEKECNNYENLEYLIKYVRKQVKMLDAMNRESFTVKPKIRWISLEET